MSASVPWKLLERLNNDEFVKLLPHLSLEHVFLTQIFIPKKKWIHLFDANFETLQVKCGGCNKQVKFSDLKNHLNQIDHEKSLRSNVKQFYHPFYTYGKGDIKLSRGEQVPKDVREIALRELATQMRSFKKGCLMAKHFAESVKRRERDDVLLQLTLNATIKKPEDMFIKVCLPFEDIPKMLFCITGGEWQPVFSYKQLTKKSKFLCNICAVNCCGIETLNAHSNGYTHKLRQLEVLALRYESSSKVNKNCCIQFGDSFSFSVKEEAKEFFKDQLGNGSAAVGGSFAIELPSDIAKKVNDLNEFVPKALTSKESLKEKREEGAQDRGAKVESNKLRGHLGVEYVLKILKHESDREPKFECGLCEFMSDVNRMQRHLLNYDHKKKYLDLHYSDTIKKFETTLGHMRFMEFRAVMGEIVDKIAIEVEKIHSRSLPYTVSANDYKVRRPDLIAEVYALLHASQNRGPSFAKILSLEEVRNLKKCSTELVENKVHVSITNVVFTTPPPNGRIYLHQMSHDPVVRLREYNAKMTNKSRESRYSRSISPARPHSRKMDHRTRSRSPISYARNRSPMRAHRSDGASVNVQHHNIWDVYRREIAVAAIEMEHAYENYRKNPESHPLYEDEWNSFWQQRKKELEREGVNHREYNFQPEWVHYFKQRIEQLFGEALHKSQINIRRKLNIPLDAEEDCQHSRVAAEQNAEEERRINNRRKHPEELDGGRANKRQTTKDFIGGAPPSKRQFPNEVFAERPERINVQQQNMVEQQATNISDNHSNVVHVLRLMTALEEHLGSLGGKVMDLLSNALQMEKTFRGNNIEFEAKILTATNCNLLETAVEKLKGILFAGLLDDKKVAGFNRIIQYTTNLLKYAEKMGWRQEFMTQRTDFHGQNSPRRDKPKHMNDPQRSSASEMQNHNEKPLSDTLMDLVVNSSQRSQQSMKLSDEQFFGSVDHHSSMPLVCPPPPTIKGTSLNPSMFPAVYNGQQNSGLALFNTKLSLDQSHSQQSRQNQTHRAEINHLQHRGSNVGGNNMNNNSFKNNNDARTTANSRPNPGPNAGGGAINNTINRNSAPGPQFKNTQFIPKLGHTNAMYQGMGEGVGGGNRNQNWSRWNNIN